MTTFLFKDFSHGLSCCPAGYPAADPSGHLLGAAAGDS